MAKQLYSVKPFQRESSDKERIMKEWSEFERAVGAEESDRERLYENFRMYWGVDYGQWDENVAQSLLDENRHPTTINLVSQKINTLAGAILQVQYDIEYVPIGGDKGALTTAFHDIYLSDRNVMGWDASFLQALRFGLIYRGDEQIYVDRRYDPEGNISFRTLPPGRVVYDQNWKTDYSEDCDLAWRFEYLTLGAISNTYGVSNEDLKREIEMLKITGQAYQATDMQLGKYPCTQKVDGLYRILEVHRVVNIKTVRLVDFSQGYNGLPFPVVDPKKDKDYLISWGNANHVNWEYVQEVPYSDRILKIYTFSPDISTSKAFEDRPSEIQVGRLDFFPWSADRLNGKNRGILDLTKDIQQTINKRQSQKTHMINSAANGAMILNENLTGGDMAKMEEIKRNKNNPAYTTTAAIDDVTKTHIVLKDNPYDAALFQDEQLMIDLLDLVTPVPAAMSSRTESSKESGVLYQSKVAIAEVGMKTLYESRKRQEIMKADAYYLQAQHTYRKTERKFIKTDNSGFTVVNKMLAVNGRPVIVNNIDSLPRCHVIIKENANGLINRAMNRMMALDMLQRIPPNLTLLQTWFSLEATGTFDLPADKKKELDLIRALEMQKAMVNYKTQISGMMANKSQADFTAMQIEMQMGQIMQQMGPHPEQLMEYEDVQPEPAQLEPPRGNNAQEQPAMAGNMQFSGKATESGLLNQQTP